MATGGTMRAGQLVRDVTTFFGQVRAEMRKVTWPDRQQLRQATIAIIVFVLALGLLIFIMDWALQLVLVQAIPSLFGAR
jgi:preprotein translocase subunit SecE